MLCRDEVLAGKQGGEEVEEDRQGGNLRSKTLDMNYMNDEMFNAYTEDTLKQKSILFFSYMYRFSYGLFTRRPSDKKRSHNCSLSQFVAMHAGNMKTNPIIQ